MVPTVGRCRVEGGARMGGAWRWGSRRRGRGGSEAAVVAGRRWPRAEEKGPRRRRVSAAGKERGGGGWLPRALGRVVTGSPGGEAHRSGRTASRRCGQRRERRLVREPFDRFLAEHHPDAGEAGGGVGVARRRPWWRGGGGRGGGAEHGVPRLAFLGWTTSRAHGGGPRLEGRSRAGGAEVGASRAWRGGASSEEIVRREKR